MALQDPYCAWSVRDGQCVSLVNSDPDRLDSAAFLQDIYKGKHEGCGHDSSLEATGDLSQTGIRMFLPSGKTEDFQPPLAPVGPASKASVEPVELAKNDATAAEENFESILPGKVLYTESEVNNFELIFN